MAGNELHPGSSRASLARGRAIAMGLLAIAVSAAVTLFCALVVRSTAAMSPGEGTGMQWVVLTPLAFLFFLVAVPTLIVGATRLQALRSAEAAEVAQRMGKRAFKLLLVSLAVMLGLFSAVSTIVSLLLGALE